MAAAAYEFSGGWRERAAADNPFLYPTLHRSSLMEWKGREAVGVGSWRVGVRSVVGVVHTSYLCQSVCECVPQLSLRPPLPPIIQH